MANKVVIGGGLALTLVSAGIWLYENADQQAPVAKYILCRESSEPFAPLLYSGAIDSDVLYEASENKWTFTTREGQEKQIVGKCNVDPYEDVPGQDVKTVIDNTGGE